MKCRLCQNEAELRGSHIIPAFFRDDSGSLFPTGKSGTPQSFTQITHTHPGKRFQRKQHGYWENRLGMIERLLCHACEQRFSALEDYAKRFFYGGTKPIRLQLPLGQEVFTADYSKMKLFQLSLLWRASEAKGEFFSGVKLCDKDGERLRQMLLSNDPGRDDEYFCAMIRLVASPAMQADLASHGIAVETGTFGPVTRSYGTWETHLLMMGGISWTFCVSPLGVPEIMRNTYIKSSGRFYLLQGSADSFLSQHSRKVVQAGNVTKADADESARTRYTRKTDR